VGTLRQDRGITATNEEARMTPITTENPTGIETFDHSRISSLPEYAVVSRALDRLVKAIEHADIEVGQAEWLQIVQQMASALPYTDTCENCVRVAVAEHRSTADMDQYPGSAPDGADVEDGWVRGRYLCPQCGTRWTCGYAVDVPQF
jgi:hypothetical protein